MFNEELIKKRIKELDNQYEQALRQLAGLEKTIRDLKRYASNLVSTGDFTEKPTRMSNEAWQKRASETIKELMKTDKKNYPTFNSVLVPIYIRLRNVYGVVLDQLRKDFKYKYDTLCYPSASRQLVMMIRSEISLTQFLSAYFQTIIVMTKC